MALAAEGVNVLPATAASRRSRRIRELAARFWLNGAMMWALDHAPWLVRFTKPFFLWWTWHFSRYLQRNTLANARHLLGPVSTLPQQQRLAKAVLSSHYDFIYDFGRMRRWPRERLLQQIDSVEGEERYRRVRALGRGAILVTAHLGSFEVAVASLTRLEPVVHVVFKRDAREVFQRLRSEQRRKLGVIEAPLDDGLQMWLALREALQRDEVVLMQADRVLPGQKGAVVDFLGMPKRIPTGPVRLALATGAPLVPVFALRTPDRRVRIVIEEPIAVEGAVMPAVRQLAAVLERYIAEYPDQWLMVHPAWEPAQ